MPLYSNLYLSDLLSTVEVNKIEYFYVYMYGSCIIGFTNLAHIWYD